ncbi:MAG: hypothetical protein RBQ97_00600 [Acholeplasma sp.]|nr:hypothetical protein [Acholeplasma sp.]
MRKLYISLLTALMVFTFLSTTAYAWIALATVNRIEQIRLSATSNTDLEISLDGIDYYTSLDKEMLDLKVASNFKFNEVTSLDGITFKDNRFNDVNGRANNDYLSVRFYFRTSTRYREIHLADNIVNADYNNVPTSGTFISSKGVSWSPSVDYLYGPNETVKKDEKRIYYAKDAMRVSFYNPNTNESKIFDLSGNEERGYGKSFGATDYLNKVLNEDNKAKTGPKTIYELSQFSETDPYSITDNSRILILEQTNEKNTDGRYFYKGEIVMNIWLEGWDADAFDAIQGDHLKMQFMFRAVMTKQ